LPVALLPLIAVGVVYVVAKGQIVIYAAAIFGPMIPIGGLGQQVAGLFYPQDIVAVLAIAALLFVTFTMDGRAIPRTPVLGLPYVLFAIAILTATIRGHYSYGASLLGEPLRLFLYAAVVVGLVGMTAERLHRMLTWLFYTGAVLVTLAAFAYLATGRSATDQAELSTGGTRLIAISTSLYCAGTLFLALLNFRLATASRERAFHLAFAALGLFGVVAGFGRAAYFGVVAVGIVFLLTLRGLRSSLMSIAPLAAPFLVLLAIGIAQVSPQFVNSVHTRLTTFPPASDPNVQWRIRANEAVYAQIRENPVFGVGFGRDAEIYIDDVDQRTGIPSQVRVAIGQDPHNGYAYLLAGGGIVALASFFLILAVFAVDVVRRFRATVDPISHLLLIWASATLFVFLFNAASGTSFASPVNILTIWALLVLPAVVKPDDARARL
jgi:O-antigen ligase